MTTSTLTIEIKWSESEIAKKSSVSTSALFLQREAEALVHSTAPFSFFFSPLFWLGTEALPHIHDTVLLYSVRHHIKKHTHMLSLFEFPPVWRYKCLAISSRLQRLTDATQTVLSKEEIHPPALFFFFNNSFKYTPCRRRSCGFLQKCSLPISSALEFDLWVVMCPSGFTPHFLCRLRVLSQVFVAKSSSFRQVDDGYPLVHTAALSAESVHFAQSGVLPRCRLWTLKH